MRRVQPSVQRRLAFAAWVRREGTNLGVRRHSNVSWYVPEDALVPAALMEGAQVDGAPASADRVRETPDRGVLREPDPTPEPEPEPEPELEAEAGRALEDLTVLELRDVATERNIEGRSQMSKAELVAALAEEDTDDALPEAR